jgi:GNAT superfamily N-acetyltransferase
VIPPYPQLTPDDEAAVRRLYARSRAFFELISGKEAGNDAPERLFVGRPAGLPQENKVVLGIYQDEQLAGVFDILLGYPNAETGFIGLFLLDPDYRGVGLGSRAYIRVEAWFQQWGLTEVQLGVQMNNADGRRFWEKHGFVYVKDVPLLGDDAANAEVHFFRKTLVPAEIGTTEA